MNPEKESELKREVFEACERCGIKGSILLYLDGDRMKVIGDISLSALTPLLLGYLTKRMQ